MDKDFSTEAELGVSTGHGQEGCSQALRAGSRPQPSHASAALQSSRSMAFSPEEPVKFLRRMSAFERRVSDSAAATLRCT